MDNSPIKSGWRGNINGHVEKTNSQVQVAEISLKLDHVTAWALCNLLTDSQVKDHPMLEQNQREMMSELGAALGRMIDHSSANNGGRAIIK
jgi:replicative DNA helicase